MTAQTQPEALHYAAILENFFHGIGRMDATGAAAVLRHQHAEVALLTEVNAQLCEQNTAVGKARAELEDELAREAQRTAAEKLRADQMTEQHRMQAEMNAEARGELAKIEAEKANLRDALSDIASGEILRSRCTGPHCTEELGVATADEMASRAAGALDWDDRIAQLPAALREKRQPLSDEQIDALRAARSLAMRHMLIARIPECGEFGQIAQNLDAVLNTIGDPT